MHNHQHSEMKQLNADENCFERRQVVNGTERETSCALF